MADHDRNPDTIIGRDADAADARRIADGEALAEQLGQTTSEDAGGNVSGTADDSCEGLDIVFEYEASEESRH
jgi:hypothetical protein